MTSCIMVHILKPSVFEKYVEGGWGGYCISGGGRSEGLNLVYTLRLRKKNIFAPPPSKYAGFKVKTRRKRIKQNIDCLFLLLLSEIIEKATFNARNWLDKAITVGESNNAEVWGRIPPTPGAIGGSGADSQRCGDSYCTVMFINQ